MKSIFVVPALVIIIASPTRGQDLSSLVAVLRGAKLIAQDEEYTFLGNFENAYSSNSIFNNFGNHGSEYSSKSIWNKYGTFGSEYSVYSPFNSYSSKPPLIIKNGKVIGYLTTNKYMKGALNPNLLKAISDEF
jgi:hypothetical protein